MYQYDASYAVEVQRAHPGRFAIVKPVNPDDPAVADVIADWKKVPGTRGPHHADEGGEPRAGRPGPRPDRTRGRSRWRPMSRCSASITKSDRITRPARCVSD